VLLLSCTDPRARPVPPLVQITVSPTLVLSSPGTIAASLFTYDADGLSSLFLSVRSADAKLVGDSAIAFAGDQQVTHVINWTVPSGMSVGTAVTLAVKVVDQAGFATLDTLHLTIQTTL
jgi:hypothetical protein